MTKIRTYSELITLQSYSERLEYLRLSGMVGKDTFGYDRYLNQYFYRDPAWKKIRRDVIVRDGACDLAIPGMEITSKILVHHMNPITKEDVLSHSDTILNPEFLVCVSQDTHNAIHYGTAAPTLEPIVRTANDTCPWRKRNG